MCSIGVSSSPAWVEHCERVRACPPSVVLVPVPRMQHRKKLQEKATGGANASSVMPLFFQSLVTAFTNDWNNTDKARGFVVQVQGSSTLGY